MSDACVVCGTTEHLVEHHTNYERDETVTVCRSCHRDIHSDPDHELYPDDERPEIGRQNRVRLSDDEMEQLREFHQEAWDEDVAEDVPYGKTISQALSLARGYTDLDDPVGDPKRGVGDDE